MTSKKVRFGELKVRDHFWYNGEEYVKTPPQHIYSCCAPDANAQAVIDDSPIFLTMHVLVDIEEE